MYWNGRKSFFFFHFCTSLGKNLYKTGTVLTIFGLFFIILSETNTLEGMTEL